MVLNKRTTSRCSIQSESVDETTPGNTSAVGGVRASEPQRINLDHVSKQGCSSAADGKLQEHQEVHAMDEGKLCSSSRTSSRARLMKAAWWSCSMLSITYRSQSARRLRTSTGARLERRYHGTWRTSGKNDKKKTNLLNRDAGDLAGTKAHRIRL